MNCWELLELKPTSDKKIIKKAYAAKLKTIDVEEEPLAFQKLKEAFDSALFLAGTLIDSEQPAKKQAESEVFVQQKEDSLLLSDEDKSELKSEQPNAIVLFEQKLTEIYEQMDFFSDCAKWTPLFSNELEWSIDEHSAIMTRMEQFFLENYRVLSREVIAYLGAVFDFDSVIRDYKLGNYFSYNWTSIKQVPLFSFAIYQDIPKEKRFAYFTNRYELFQCIASSHPDKEEWQQRLDSCRAVSTTDYDVINLEIAMLLMGDFRMEQAQTMTTVKTLLSEVRNLKENETSEFFNAYYQWIEQKKAVNEVLVYDSSTTAVPESMINLLKGYAYFKLGHESRTRECWSELAKKNPSLFRPNELAIIVPQASPAQLPKKKRGSGSYLWVGLLILLAIFRIGHAFSGLSERNAYKPPANTQYLNSIENEFRADYLSKDLSKLKESNNLSDQFLYYFYIDRSDDDREEFIEANFAGRAKEMALQMVETNLPTIELKSRYGYYPSPDTVAEYGSVTALTLSKENKPFAILNQDKEGRIVMVYGAGWEVLPDEKFDALWTAIQVRPIMSQKFFVVYYLLSTEREETLKDNPEYATDAIKKLLEKNKSMPVATEFESGTWQISQDDEGHLYTIVNDNESRHRFILSYDNYGRLEHVYGDKWEPIGESKKQEIYANAEEKNGMF